MFGADASFGVLGMKDEDLKWILGSYGDDRSGFMESTPQGEESSAFL